MQLEVLAHGTRAARPLLIEKGAPPLARPATNEGTNRSGDCGAVIGSLLSTGVEPVAGYAQLGEQRIAYQIIGDGAIDLLITAGFWSSFDVEWEHSLIRLFYQRLASFCRVIRFDRRGTGGSDPIPLDALPPWEAFAEEIEAVMDAAESEQAAVMTIADAGPVGLLFASTRPSRTQALLLFNSSARLMKADDYPIGLTIEEYEAMSRAVSEEWGTGSQALVDFFYPS